MFGSLETMRCFVFELFLVLKFVVELVSFPLFGYSSFPKLGNIVDVCIEGDDIRVFVVVNVLRDCHRIRILWLELLRPLSYGFVHVRLHGRIRTSWGCIRIQKEKIAVNSCN